MIVRPTKTFLKWVKRIRDDQAQTRITMRIRRLSLGNPGDFRSVGDGVFEMRINYGPGYRVYYIQRGTALVILLAGGDKRTQERDIAKAKKLAKNLED